MLMTELYGLAWIFLGPLVAMAVWTLVVCVPGHRTRWIFKSRPVWLLLWLRGELTPGVTLLTGGPLAALAYAWIAGMGYGATGVRAWLLAGAWCLLFAVALTNATRKSRPEGAACAGLVMLVTLLLLAGVAAMWQAAEILRG